MFHAFSITLPNPTPTVLQSYYYSHIWIRLLLRSLKIKSLFGAQLMLYKSWHLFHDQLRCHKKMKYRMTSTLQKSPAVKRNPADTLDMPPSDTSVEKCIRTNASEWNRKYKLFQQLFFPLTTCKQINTLIRLSNSKTSIHIPIIHDLGISGSGCAIVSKLRAQIPDKIHLTFERLVEQFLFGPSNLRGLSLWTALN